MPGIRETRLTAAIPRLPIPINPTRILDIAGTLKFAAGVPTENLSTIHPDIAASPSIHAEPLRKSLRVLVE
jgi:hypothetical protein